MNESSGKVPAGLGNSGLGRKPGRKRPMPERTGAADASTAAEQLGRVAELRSARQMMKMRFAGRHDTDREGQAHPAGNEPAGGLGVQAVELQASSPAVRSGQTMPAVPTAAPGINPWLDQRMSQEQRIQALRTHLSHSIDALGRNPQYRDASLDPREWHPEALRNKDVAKAVQEVPALAALMSPEVIAEVNRSVRDPGQFQQLLTRPDISDNLQDLVNHKDELVALKRAFEQGMAEQNAHEGVADNSRNAGAPTAHGPIRRVFNKLIDARRAFEVAIWGFASDETDEEHAARELPHIVADKPIDPRVYYGSDEPSQWVPDVDDSDWAAVMLSVYAASADVWWPVTLIFCTAAICSFVALPVWLLLPGLLLFLLVGVKAFIMVPRGIKLAGVLETRLVLSIILCIEIISATDFLVDHLVNGMFIKYRASAATLAVVCVVIPILHLKCALSDPGYLQRGVGGYQATGDAEDGFHMGPCASCKTVRPLRSKHCPTCKRCVGKMDHHCPALANCVGERNERWFLTYLTVALVGLALYVFLTTVRTTGEAADDVRTGGLKLLRSWLRGSFQLFPGKFLLVLVNVILLVSVASLVFRGWLHASRNITTNEAINRRRYWYFIHGRYNANPFDRGVWKNLCDFWMPEKHGKGAIDWRARCKEFHAVRETLLPADAFSQEV